MIILDKLKLLIFSDILSIVGTIIAIISVFVSIYSNRLSKKALLIAQKDYQNKQTNFKLYMINGYRCTLKQRSLLLFNISISNKSDNKNSFKTVLEIEYIKKNDTVSRVKLHHNPELRKILPNNKFTMFDSDIRIEERMIESKWLIFEEPIDIFDHYKIEKYSVVITDIRPISNITHYEYV